MATRTRSNLAGGIMVLTGLAVALEARSFGVGSLARVGPGLYPGILGVALTLVGLAIAMTPATAEDGETSGFGRPDWRGWSCIIGGIVLFIFLGEFAGLGPATFACVLVSAFGDRKATLRAALILATVAMLVAAVVFSWMLQFQLPFWRAWG